MPLADRQFDAVLSIGAFNYFNDPEGALCEMVRWPARRADRGTDELPNLTDRMLGHKLGFPAVDRWIVSRLMHLGDSFTEMVERHRNLDVPAVAAKVLPDAEIIRIWQGVGYVLVGMLRREPIVGLGMLHVGGSGPSCRVSLSSRVWMRPTAADCDRPSRVPTSASGSPLRRWIITASRWSAGSEARALAIRWSCSFRSALRLGEV